jgi:GNAT superfamily N-acetyltransferase
MRQEVQPHGMRREAFHNGVRLVDLNGREGTVIYSSLAPHETDRVIREQIDYFKGLEQDFEWKVFTHDQPPDLKERLVQHGFEMEDTEALLVLDLSRASLDLLAPPVRKVCRILPESVSDFKAVLFAVWGECTIGLAERLVASLMWDPASVSMYVAYDNGRPVSCGWTSFNAGKHFAGLWSGSTLPEYRGKGFYRAVVAARVQEARERDIRFAAVDAKPTSRPILQKLGFQLIGWSQEFKWRVNQLQRNGGS